MPVDQPQLVHPRPFEDVIDMGAVVQANLVQLRVSNNKSQDVDNDLHTLRVQSPGAITRYREALITRQQLAAYDPTALHLRMHEVWGQFCLMCWYVHIDDPQSSPSFKMISSSQPTRCQTVAAAKCLELEKSLWRIQFEQRLRHDPELRTEATFEKQYHSAQNIPVLVRGENIRVCKDASLILGACEFAGMLAAARWITDTRWTWAESGIMDVSCNDQPTSKS